MALPNCRWGYGWCLATLVKGTRMHPSLNFHYQLQVSTKPENTLISDLHITFSSQDACTSPLINKSPGRERPSLPPTLFISGRSAFTSPDSSHFRLPLHGQLWTGRAFSGSLLCSLAAAKAWLYPSNTHSTGARSESPLQALLTSPDLDCISVMLPVFLLGNPCLFQRSLCSRLPTRTLLLSRNHSTHPEFSSLSDTQGAPCRIPCPPQWPSEPCLCISYPSPLLSTAVAGQPPWLEWASGNLQPSSLFVLSITGSAVPLFSSDAPLQSHSLCSM